MFELSDQIRLALTVGGIFLCIIQSGIFSGLNLALFGVTRLRLELEVAAGNKAAEKVQRLRQDSNFLLTTILWGNVAVNTLLAILSNSVLTGALAFLFSTILITFVGEILPQAYFSRHAIMMGARLAPILSVYQILLYPVAKPTALALDWWLGKEGIYYFRERDLRELISKHVEAEGVEIDHVEGTGALNFLSLDDLTVAEEGEPLDPRSIVALPTNIDLPQFPEFERSPDDPFIRQIEASGHKWVILTDLEQTPYLVLDADAFLRAAVLSDLPIDPYRYCHRPVIVTDIATPIGDVIERLRVEPVHKEDDVVDHDIILIWGEQKRVITGADILGRLLRGIVRRTPRPPGSQN